MSDKEKIPVSFEVFPPKTSQGLVSLQETCKKLNGLNPHFFSVTFGAIGTSQQSTVTTVEQLIKNYFPTTPHISCVGMNQARLLDFLEKYQQWGIRRLVVIRGDLTAATQSDASDFKYAADLVAAIRQISGDYFHINVAAYPEFHPESANYEEDFLNLSRKIDAGANSAITQFFFNSDAFFRFKESCQKNGIHIPIIPGILPIYDYEKLLRFSSSCGAEIPLWLRKRLEKFAHNPTATQEIGFEITTKLCQQLIKEGVESLHFYTLNQLDMVWKIYHHL